MFLTGVDQWSSCFVSKQSMSVTCTWYVTCIAVCTWRMVYWRCIYFVKSCRIGRVSPWDIVIHRTLRNCAENSISHMSVQQCPNSIYCLSVLSVDIIMWFMYWKQARHGELCILLLFFVYFFNDSIFVRPIISYLLDVYSSDLHGWWNFGWRWLISLKLVFWSCEGRFHGGHCCVWFYAQSWFAGCMWLVAQPGGLTLSTALRLVFVTLHW